MTTPTAYAEIDAGNAKLRNRWMACVWSTFLGQLLELHTAGRESDWLDAPCNDWHIGLDGRAIGPMDAGPVEWSEVSTPFSVGLSARFVGASLAIELETHALFEAPAFRRVLAVSNRSIEPVRVESLGPWTLPMPFQERESTPTDEPLPVLARHENGANGLLILGNPEFTLDNAGRPCYLLRRRGSPAAELVSGQGLQCPDLWWMPYDSGRDAALGRRVDAVRRVAHAWEAWRRERAARTQADDA